jgi:RND superfamily putative drug exporter
MGTPLTRSKFTAAGIALVWLALLAACLPVAARLGEVAVTDPIRFFPPDAPGRASARAFDRLFPGSVAASQVAIVLEADGDAAGAPMAEPARSHVARLAERLRAQLPEDGGDVVLAPTDDPAVADRLVSPDGRAALVLVQLRAGFASEEASAAVAEVERVVADAFPAAGLRASLTGHATLGRDYLRAIEDGARRSALATVALVAVTLLLVYRAPLAALASLATLGIALGVASGAVALAAQLGLPVAFQSRGFLVATVYGVGTDYCLLLFARAREEDGIGRALRATAPVLVTSALAVALACALMGLARFGLFAWSGPSLAIGVGVTLAAVLTLAPALMVVAGGALFWPRARASRPLGDRLWQGIARLVLARPATVFAGALVLVVPLALAGRRAEPSFELELDFPQASVSEAGWAALVRHFDPARVAPLTLAVELAAGADGASDPGWRSTGGLDGLYQLTGWLAAQPGVARVWSATQPTGEPRLLARGTLRSQLGALASGLGEARAGAERLAGGLGDARRGVADGRAQIARQQSAIEAEQKGSLLGAFAPGRFESARRDLGDFDVRLGRLEEGLGAAAGGAHQLADGVARAERRLDDLVAAPGAARLLDRLALTPEDVAGIPDLARAFAYFLSADARAARFELQLAEAPNSAGAVETLERLGRELAVVLPALGFPGARVHATGQTPITADLGVLTRTDMGRLSVWVVGGVFALLVALLRGVAAPVAITAFILLSYFAALGALAVGVSAGAWPGLDWKAPFFVFVLLVAIGADYGVFLLGRAREEAARLPYREALARALTATGPVITSCGLVLAGTFATLFLSRIAFLEQVAIGITVGVLVDTLIVRPFLLPAAALLLARGGGAGASAARSPRAASPGA